MALLCAFCYGLYGTGGLYGAAGLYGNDGSYGNGGSYGAVGLYGTDGWRELVKSGGGFLLKEAMAMLAVYLFFTVVTAAAVTDWRTRKIPNKYCVAVFILAVFGSVTMPLISVGERGLGCLVISVPMLLTAVVLPGAFGGGDVKLMFVSGLFLGWRLTVLSFIFTVLAAGAYALVLLIKGNRRDTKFALGPFLGIGMASAMLAGEGVLRVLF